MSQILDDAYFENWEKTLDRDGRLWLAVCTAKNQRQRDRAYRKWYNRKFGERFVFR